MKMTKFPYPTQVLGERGGRAIAARLVPAGFDMLVRMLQRQSVGATHTQISVKRRGLLVRMLLRVQPEAGTLLACMLSLG